MDSADAGAAGGLRNCRLVFGHGFQKRRGWHEEQVSGDGAAEVQPPLRVTYVWNGLFAVSEEELQNCGDFLRFLVQYSLVSLQPRLCGGEGSLPLTLLRENSLLTGKNIGNLFVLQPQFRPCRLY